MNPISAFLEAGVNFHLRAAAVFLYDDHILAHQAVGDTIWALPGGHVEPWEDTATTLARECQEEINAEIEIGPLLWIVENYWTDGTGRNHEVGFYYRTEFRDPTWYDTSRAFTGREDLWIPGESLTLQFRWLPLPAIDQFDLRPAFLRTALQNPPAHTVHIIHRSES